MDRLKAMQAFVRIVEANSFTRAAESLELPRAALTATIQRLEGYLGTRLLQRSTRSLSLTTDGADYYAKCLEILGAIDAAEAGFRGGPQAPPRGRLRLDLPGALGRNVVLPRLHDFRAACPEVELVVSVGDRLADLTRDGIDCALRVGELQDSTLVARRLGSMRFLTCAAPSLLARYGMPSTLAALKAMPAVVQFSGRTGRPFSWDFVVEGKVETIEVAGPVAVNDADAYVCCGVQGLGLIQAAAYQVRPYLAAGALVEVLPELPSTPMPVSLVYPQGRMLAPRLRAFADWLEGVFESEPELRR